MILERNENIEAERDKALQKCYINYKHFEHIIIPSHPFLNKYKYRIYNKTSIYILLLFLSSSQPSSPGYPK